MNDETPAPPRPWRMSTSTWVVTVLGVTLLLLVGIWAGWRMHLSARMNDKVEAIRAAGYPMSPAELEAWYPYPEGPNAADVLEEAFLRYREVELPDDGETVPIFGSADLPEPGLPLSEAAREGLLLAVEANRDAIERLHEAAAIPESRFPIDLTTPYMDVLLPHLSPLAYGAKLLRADALLALDAGDSDRARRDVMSLLRLSQTLKEEPVLISMLVAISVRSWAFETMQHILSRGEIAPEAMEEAAALWDEAGASRRFGRILAGERAGPWSLAGSDLHEYLGDEWDVTLWEGVGAKEVAGLRSLDRLLFLEKITQFIDIVQHESVSAWRRESEALERELENSLPGYATYTRLVLTVIFPTTRTVLPDVAQGRIVRLAAAVERFRHEHGRTPATLAELEAEDVVIPLDPMDGLPLRYRPLEHGYLIYSVGRNGVDDGGANDDMPFRVQRLPAEVTPDDAGEEDAG